MVAGETIAVVSFDEASSRYCRLWKFPFFNFQNNFKFFRLSNMAKQMFYELGSGLVQNIKFRASWYLIGQKGIQGFSPFEELNFPSGNDWAKPIDHKLCVPNTCWSIFYFCQTLRHLFVECYTGTLIALWVILPPYSRISHRVALRSFTCT